MKLKYFPYLFGAVGLVVILMAINAYLSTKEFLDNSIVAHGKILANERPTGSQYFYSRVRFVDNQASVGEFVSNIGNKTPAYAVGDAVEVIYSAAGEQGPRIKTFSSLWGAR